MSKEPSQHSQAVIQSASALVLRIGVLLSTLVMIVGICFSFAHGTSKDSMKTVGFDPSPSHIFDGLHNTRGKSIIEVGILLLVLTPIARVAASTILFAFAQRDRLYTIITLMVLIMTLAGLFIIR